MREAIDIDALFCVVRDIGKTVVAQSDPTEVAGMVSNKLIHTLGAVGATTIVINPQTEGLDIELHEGREFGLDQQNPSKWRARAVELDRDVELNFYQTLELTPPEAADRGGAHQSVLDLPFRFQDGMIGFIRCYSDQPFSLDDRLTNTLKIMIHQGSCAMEKARLIHKQRSEYEYLAASTEKMSAMGRLAAGVAHEINNPLAGILLFSTNLLKKVGDDSPLKEGLTVITEEVMRCKVIIQELLEFSRDKEPVRLQVELNTIIDKAIMIVDNEYRLRRIVMEKRLSENLPPITVDPSQMEQVAVNLLLNAAEAVENDGRVVVESRVAEDGENLELSVSDDGCGIEAHNLSNIFDPFFSTKPQGTGLGLAVTYGLIQNHGGTIKVVSEPGKGSTFTVYLPLSKNSSSGG